MNVFVSCFQIFGPQISVLDPYVFQYGAAVPLPFPSTFIGALTYTYATGSGKSFLRVLNDLVSRVKEDSLYLNVTVTIPPDSCLVKTRLILRRNRFLDSDHMPRWKGKRLVLGKSQYWGQEVVETSVEPPPSFSYYFFYQQHLFDALYREYIFAQKLLAFVLTNSESVNRVIKEYVPSIYRLGDTESLVAIKYIQSSEEPRLVRKVEKGKVIEHINTLVVASRDNEVYLTPVSGEFTMIHGMPIHVLKDRDNSEYVSKQIHSFLCPLRIRKIRDKHQVYELSEFAAETKLEHYLIDEKVGENTFRIVIPVKYFEES
ncbi:MAG: type I-A CRISPR-associated protein Cas5 [Candidatus Brockarchaeota archaeon]|nr:type I-A CRISPR-associated protein Cas5 [Candidatus Brockarchaeota archaeon]